MNVQAIIDRARRLGYVSSSQYSDAKALEDFNIIRRKLGKIFIQRLDEDYFFDILTQDSVLGQTEYGLNDTTNNIEIDKVKSVFVKESSTATDYTPAVEVYTDELDKDLSWYAENQPTSSPIYHISDESIFIYPATLAVTAGIKTRVTLKLNDLLITDDEAAILMDCEDLISDGMLPFIYQSRGLINEKNDSFIGYQNGIEDYIELMSERTSKSSEDELPEGLAYFE